MSKKELLIERVRSLEKSPNSYPTDSRERGWNEALNEVVEIIKASDLEDDKGNRIMYEDSGQPEYTG